jgi:hypothetical protein
MHATRASRQCSSAALQVSLWDLCGGMSSPAGQNAADPGLCCPAGSICNYYNRWWGHQARSNAGTVQAACMPVSTAALSSTIRPRLLTGWLPPTRCQVVAVPAPGLHGAASGWRQRRPAGARQDADRGCAADAAPGRQRHQPGPLQHRRGAAGLCGPGHLPGHRPRVQRHHQRGACCWLRPPPAAGGRPVVLGDCTGCAQVLWMRAAFLYSTPGRRLPRGGNCLP